MKGASADDIMAAGEMKMVLAVAKQGTPVSCAIALTKDKEGILLLDKRIKPKTLAANLRAQADDLSIELDMATLRFGRATISEADQSLVTLAVNKKPPSTLRPKLLERLKKAGYSSLELTVGDDHEEEDDSGDPKQAAIVEALKKMLVTVTAGKKEILAKSPTLIALAKGAANAIEHGDLKQANTAIIALQKQLATSEAAGSDGSGDWAKKQAEYGKAAQIWAGVFAATEQDLHKIKDEIIKAFGGDAEGKQLEKEFVGELDTTLEALDLSLHKGFDALAKAKGGQGADKLRGALSKRVADYMAFVETDHFMKNIDANPYGIKIIGRLTTSLAKLEDALRA